MLEATAIQTSVDYPLDLAATTDVIVKLADPVKLLNGGCSRSKIGRWLKGGFTLQTCNEECHKTEWCIYTTTVHKYYRGIKPGDCWMGGDCEHPYDYPHSGYTTYQSKVKVGYQESMSTYFNAIAKQLPEIQENKAALTTENAAIAALEHQATADKSTISALQKKVDTLEAAQTKDQS